MAGPFRNLLLSAIRRPGRALVAVLLVAAAGLALWYGGRALWYRWERAEADRATAGYDFAEARRRLAWCVWLWPADAETRLAAARAARRDGDLDGAEEHLRAYHRLAGAATAEERLERAMLTVQRGRLDEATPYLIEQLEDHHPESEQIFEALALGCVSVYHLDRASFWVREMQERFPHNPVGRLLEAQTTETLGHREHLLEKARSLVADYPAYAKAREYLADLLAEDHEYDEAIGQYEELRRRDPTGLKPLLGLARCLMALDRKEEARPLMATLEREHADSGVALLLCGRFALKEKRPEDAGRLLRRALEQSPADPEVHFSLAVCLQQLGQPEEARRHLERGKEIEADLMKLENAVEAMSKAPNEPGPRLEAGRICLRNGQVAEGLRWLYGALEVAPNDAETHRTLADFFESRGDRERAQYHRNRALGLPDIPGSP